MIDSSQHTSPQHASALPGAAVGGPPDVEILRDLIESTGQLRPVALDDLVSSVSLVRSGGMKEDHVHVLADLAELPPIVVQASSMRVIDGLYRVQVARTRGQNEITAWVVDCDDTTAYLAAVAANISHGLPLSPQERKTAARRILEMCPQWSDRAIAKGSGLSNKTVATIRGCATEEIPQLHNRVGEDGRQRPSDPSEARRRAAEVWAKDLEQSLRAVAREVGSSPATVRDVRDRMLRGEDPVLPRQRTRDSVDRVVTRAVEQAVPPDWDPHGAIANLKRDPSLRYSDAGKQLLHLLDVCLGIQERIEKIMPYVPPHCAETVSLLVHDCSTRLGALAENLMRELVDMENTG